MPPAKKEQDEVIPVDRIFLVMTDQAQIPGAKLRSNVKSDGVRHKITLHVKTQQFRVDFFTDKEVLTTYVPMHRVTNWFPGGKSKK